MADSNYALFYAGFLRFGKGQIVSAAASWSGATSSSFPFESHAFAFSVWSEICLCPITVGPGPWTVCTRSRTSCKRLLLSSMDLYFLPVDGPTASTPFSFQTERRLWYVRVQMVWHYRQPPTPVVLLVVAKNPSCCFHGLIRPFALSVGLRVMC